MSFLLNIRKPNYTINNIKFCFITSSYNQEQFIIMNLNSIRAQKYNNYRILYFIVWKIIKLFSDLFLVIF